MFSAEEGLIEQNKSDIVSEDKWMAVVVSLLPLLCGEKKHTRLKKKQNRQKTSPFHLQGSLSLLSESDRDEKAESVQWAHTGE